MAARGAEEEEVLWAVGRHKPRVHRQPEDLFLALCPQEFFRILTAVDALKSYDAPN